MTKSSASSPSSDALRGEIAALAARLIAENGAGYHSAKRKAAQQLLGNHRSIDDYLPSNEQVEQELHLYNQLFLADTQPARLLHLRRLALEFMQLLEPFQPYLIGAVLNGTAGEHSDIHLHLFADSAKDVAIFLINRSIRYELSESPHFDPRQPPVETLSLMWHGEGIHLAVYQPDDVRSGGKRKSDGKLQRADAVQLQRLLDVNNGPTDPPL